MSTIEEQIRAIADEAFAQSEPLLRAQRTAGTVVVRVESVDVSARRGVRNRAALLAVAAAVLGAVIVGGLLIGTDRGAEPMASDEPTLPIGAPVTRSIDGLGSTDVAVSPGAARLAVARPDEICAIWTSPTAPTDSDRCYPVPFSVATDSITWSPDATSLVFHHDPYRLGQEPDLVELDLARGEVTVLTDDGVPPIGGEGGDIDVAPIFGSDGTLYFFRVDTSDGTEAALQEYDSSGGVSPTGSVVPGFPRPFGRRLDGDSIVTTSVGSDGAEELVSIDTAGGPIRSIRLERPGWAVVGAARDRALLVVPDDSEPTRPGSLELSIADFDTGEISPIALPPLESSMRVSGAGLSPDGARIAVIVADQRDADGHQLLVADITDDTSVGPFALVATGPQFAPNDGDRSPEPAGLGRFGEIGWTDASLVYSLGPDQLVTLPLR